MLFNCDLTSLWNNLVDYGCEVSNYCAIWPSNTILKFSDYPVIEFVI